MPPKRFSVLGGLTGRTVTVKGAKVAAPNINAVKEVVSFGGGSRLAASMGASIPDLNKAKKAITNLGDIPAARNFTKDLGSIQERIGLKRVGIDTPRSLFEGVTDSFDRIRKRVLVGLGATTLLGGIVAILTTRGLGLWGGERWGSGGGENKDKPKDNPSNPSNSNSGGGSGGGGGSGSTGKDKGGSSMWWIIIAGIVLILIVAIVLMMDEGEGGGMSDFGD